MQFHGASELTAAAASGSRRSRGSDSGPDLQRRECVMRHARPALRTVAAAEASSHTAASRGKTAAEAPPRRTLSARALDARGCRVAEGSVRRQDRSRPPQQHRTRDEHQLGEGRVSRSQRTRARHAEEPCQHVAGLLADERLETGWRATLAGRAPDRLEPGQAVRLTPGSSEQPTGTGPADLVCD